MSHWSAILSRSPSCLCVVCKAAHKFIVYGLYARAGGGTWTEPAISYPLVNAGFILRALLFSSRPSPQTSNLAAGSPYQSTKILLSFPPADFLGTGFPPGSKSERRKRFTTIPADRLELCFPSSPPPQYTESALDSSFPYATDFPIQYTHWGSCQAATSGASRHWLLQRNDKLIPSCFLGEMGSPSRNEANEWLSRKIGKQ